MNGERYALVHGDAVETLRSLPAASMDHAIFDPPYSPKVHKAHRIGHTGKDSTRPNATRAQTNRVKDLGFEALNEALRDRVAIELGRVVKRWTLVFSDQEGVGSPQRIDIERSPVDENGVTVITPGTGWIGALERAGLEYVRTMVWVKKGSTPQFTGDRPAQGHECIVLAHRRHPVGKPMKKRWNGGGKRGVYSYPIVLNRSGKSPRLHTTQKPLELMSQLVADFTDPDDLIVDPFAGSGTTLLAAQLAGRQWLGVERDRRYYLTAEQRLEAAIAGAEISSEDILDAVETQLELEAADRPAFDHDAVQIVFKAHVGKVIHYASQNHAVLKQWGI